MSLKYKIVSTYKPGQGKKGEEIWFPKLTGSKLIGMRELAQKISERSTANVGDIYLVVLELVDVIPRLLADGYTVKLDELGSFRLHARVKTSSSFKDVSARDMKELRMTFKPDRKIKERFLGVKVVPDKHMWR